MKRENKLKKRNEKLDAENKEAFEKGEGKQLDIQYETVRDIKDSLDNNKYIKNHHDDDEKISSHKKHHQLESEK